MTVAFALSMYRSVPVVDIWIAVHFLVYPLYYSFRYHHKSRLDHTANTTHEDVYALLLDSRIAYMEDVSHTHT